MRCLVILAAEDDEEIDARRDVAPHGPTCDSRSACIPINAHRFAADSGGAARLVAERLTTVPGVCAVGEIGLDYHYDFSPSDVQQAVFRAQLALALNARLAGRDPHPRSGRRHAADHRRRAAALAGVFHCFSGDARPPARALATGFFVSIPGIATFPKSDALRDAARDIPADNC